MKVIGRRSELQPDIDKVIDSYRNEGIDATVGLLHKRVLKKKVRFPVLEYVAKTLYEAIPAKEQLSLTDKVIELPEVGRYVIAGIILQLRSEKHHKASIQKAAEYIVQGNDWLACDIIGERVMGHALLTEPVKTLPLLKKLAWDENKWLVRCVGVAAHYAIKKGLKKQYVDEMFVLLLSLCNTTDFHTKKGIGWAAKTSARFHPDVIAKYQLQIERDERVKQWFRTKIKIGLGRSYKYAQRYHD